MKKHLLKIFRLRAVMLVALLCAGFSGAWGETTYEQLTSIANIDESAQYVLGIDGTGFHYSGTSSWGLTALPSEKTPLYYTLTKSSNGDSFTAKATINGTQYYLQVPTSNTFSMATSAGTNTDLIIGTTQISNTNYAVANKTTTARHLRINGTSGLRSYAGTTGTMAFFYKIIETGQNTSVTINNSGITNTDIYAGTSAGTLTATVKDASGNVINGATVTWSSNNTAVATIGSDGDITLVGAGETIITANYAGISNTYNSSSKTYTLTVTDSTPFTGGNVTFKAGTDKGSTQSNNSPDQVIKSGVTMYCNDAAFATDQYRFYKNSETTISAPEGYHITQIIFLNADTSYPCSNLAKKSGTEGEYNNETNTWTGAATTARFVASAQARAAQVVVTIAITENHTAKFFINGIEQTDAQVEAIEGATITFPANPTGLYGKSFVGWGTQPINGTTNDIPTLINSRIMGNRNISYYAIFADKQEGEDETDVLDRAFTGVTGNSYSNWSGKTGTSGAVYAGNSAGGYSSIQLNSDSPNGIISTSSIGNVKKITISWNTNTTSGRKLNVYGKNTAYSNVSDLYNSSNQGTLIGTIVRGTSTSLTITGDYAYIGLRSSSGAMYLNTISIEWQAAPTYSAYCTTIPNTAAFTLSENCYDLNNGTKTYYGTFSNSSAFVVPEGVTAHTVSVANGVLSVTDYEAGAVVPANTGVMVSSATAGEKTVNLTNENGSALTNNMLKPTGAGITADAMAAANSGCKFYYLTMNGEQIGFYRRNDTGAKFDMPVANKAYLAVPEGQVGNIKDFSFNDIVDGIDAVETTETESNAIYNLAGQRVSKMQKGIYIVNGKKVLVK